LKTIRHAIGIALVTLGTFIFFGLLDGATTGTFVWEAALFGALAGFLIYAGILVGFSHTDDKRIASATQGLDEKSPS
jgi:hypothetical protein